MIMKVTFRLINVNSLISRIPHYDPVSRQIYWGMKWRPVNPMTQYSKFNYNVADQPEITFEYTPLINRPFEDALIGDIDLLRLYGTMEESYSYTGIVVPENGATVLIDVSKIPPSVGVSKISEGETLRNVIFIGGAVLGAGMILGGIKKHRGGKKSGPKSEPKSNPVRKKSGSRKQSKRSVKKGR
jgi:hypothetical protein